MVSKIQNRRKLLITGVLAFGVIVITLFAFQKSCSRIISDNDTAVTKKPQVLHRIMERQKLVAITDYNSINYFIYRGKPMGYQYDLLQNYADYLGVELEVRVDNRMEKKFDCINHGDCDILGIDLTVTKERSRLVDFTIPHSLSRQVLVQRKPEGFTRMGRRQLEDSLIRNQLELGGKVVHVQAGSAFASRLRNLSDEIGEDIHIVESEHEAEHLVRLVARGEIDYTVCDEHVAMVNRTYYNNIDISTPVSFVQQLAWAVQKGADSLLLSINQWLEVFKASPTYHAIYHKYFLSRRSPHKQHAQYHSFSGGRISPYDDLIREYSAEIGWDWRLVASLIFQESRFDPEAVSWAGAVGLMQLMPATGEQFGARDLMNPRENIRAGINFIRYLEQEFEKMGKEEPDRTRFVLAAYNAGLGHILDARRLAEKYNADKNKWNEVDTFLVYKSRPEYYNDPVVEFGYVRGEETYNFVREVMERYEHYKNLLPES